MRRSYASVVDWVPFPLFSDLSTSRGTYAGAWGAAAHRSLSTTRASRVVPHTRYGAARSEPSGRGCDAACSAAVREGHELPHRARAARRPAHRRGWPRCAPEDAANLPRPGRGARAKGGWQLHRGAGGRAAGPDRERLVDPAGDRGHGHQRAALLLPRAPLGRGELPHVPRGDREVSKAGGWLLLRAFAARAPPCGWPSPWTRPDPERLRAPCQTTRSLPLLLDALAPSPPWGPRTPLD